jgi:peptidoglycan/LPS O-acetylase OafA/YrhL
MKKIFYPEIQALRALAVISIFLYHMQIKNFEGGFIGVDIFFVISGFLITKILIEKKLSIYEFYISRLKRILPALIFTIFFCIIISNLIFLPEHLEHFYNSTKYSVFFLSNVFFWLKTQDYFNINSYFQPLLHTWSLSLEIQFYLIFPFLIFFLKKKNFNKKIVTILFIAFISIILSVLFIGREQSFYFLPFRFCEFLMGSAVYFLKKKNLNIENSKTSFIFCLFIIILSILFINNLNFPGVKGFLISFFTGGLIFFKYPKIINTFIKAKTIQFIGMISYSFFLFHWPIIVFYKYLKITPFNFLDLILITIISFFISTFSYFLLEKKFNVQSLIKFHKFLFIYPFIVIFILISLYKLKNYSINLNIFMNQNKNLLFQQLKEFSDERDKYLREIILDEHYYNKQKNQLIIGDSHATDIFLGIRQNNINNFYYISNNLGCLKILSQNINIHFFEKFKEYLFSLRSVSKHEYEKCNLQIMKIKNILENQKIEKIIISMKWNESEIAYLPFLIKILKKNNTDIVLVSRRLEIPNIKMAILKNDNILNVNDFLNKNYKMYDEINKKLNIIATKNSIKFFDLNKYICDQNKKSCNFIYGNYFKYLDYSHFTLEFAKNLMAENLDKF